MSSLKNIRFISIIIIFVGISSNYTHSDAISIQTSSGVVLSQKFQNVLLWEDIPYALAPIGNLRWKAPREFINKDYKILPKENNFCHQEIGGEIQEIYDQGSEDCLYLDIRKPNKSKNNIPVMFWIHGGGNTSGHKDFYDFSEFVQKEDVIVVSANYRLGPLGFFTHPAINKLNEGIDQTSNFGILDIIAALKWVKENIQYFGGDPNNITIFGESAGGHNVLSLLVAPQAKGLFHKAISQSGYTKSSSLQNAYKSQFYNQDNTSDSWTVLNKVLMSEKNINISEADEFQNSSRLGDLRTILYQTDAQDLVNLYGDTFETPLLTNDDIVIPKIGLLKALGSEEYLYKVPTIAGSNKDEIKLWIGFSEYFIKAEKSFLSRAFNVPKIEIKNKNQYEFYNSIRSQGWQLRGVQEPLENLFNAGNSDIYAYRFDWDNLRDFFIGEFSEIIGSAHALEIPMVSGDYGMVGDFQWIVYPRSPSRRFVSRNMMNFWSNFAKNGVPGNSTNNIEWKKFDPSASRSILIIDEKKNLRSSNLNLDLDLLVKNILNSQILINEEKCIILYETTNYIGDDSFDSFNKNLGFECSRDEALRISKKNSGSINL